MSESEEGLDDLHKSILDMCGADLKIPSKKRHKDLRTNLDRDFHRNANCDLKPANINCDDICAMPDREYDGLKEDISVPPLSLPSTSDGSPSKKSDLSELVYSASCSDFETVDETSCSDSEAYTTVSETVTSPTKFENSELYLTVNEAINTPNLNRGKNLSPIKVIENETKFLLSAPNTPSFLATGSERSSNFAHFAQSTPLQKMAKAMMTIDKTGEDLSKIDEEDNSLNIGDQTGGRKVIQTEEADFSFDESDFSDMSFDDLLLDTFALCKGEDYNWDIFEKDKKRLKSKKNLRKELIKDSNDVTVLEVAEKSKLEETIKYPHFHEINKLENNKNDNEKEKHKQTSEKGYIPESKSENDLAEKLTDAHKKITKSDSVNDKVIPSTSTSQTQADPKINSENLHVSKIKIDSIFADKAAKDSKQTSNGRFSNFSSSILSDIEITEDESELDMSADVLGLNNFTYNEADDIDLDEEDEATLLDETIVDLPDSIKNKYKLQEQVTILSKSDTSVNDGNQTIVENQNATTFTDENKNLLNLKNKSEEKVEPDVEDQKVKEEVKTESKEKGEGDIKKEEEVKSEITDIEKITGKIDYEAERKYFKIESPEVKGIIEQWGSQGIQDPDINLSCATNYRAKNRQEKGLLEGKHISCIWLPESVAEINTSSPMKKRQRLDSEAHNRRDIQNLEEELEAINFRHEVCLQDLFEEWQYEKQHLRESHIQLNNQLLLRQRMEMKENYFMYRFSDIPFFEMNFRRLFSEHTQQKEEIKARFVTELEKLKHIFQRREVDIERNFNHRKAQLKSLIGQIKHVQSDGKYGHHVTAQFVKGPCRSNNLTRSLVEVYVPADVATCILKEDEVIDSYYKYA